MKDKELLSALMNMNLSENEAKCYLALFKGDSLTASETSKLSGVPRQNAYKALEKLLSKGLAVMVPEGVNRYRVSNPSFFKEKAMGEIKESVENELQELEQRKREMLKENSDKNMKTNLVFEQLESLYKSSRDVEQSNAYIEVMRDIDQINKTYIQTMKKSKKEVLSFTRERYVNLPEKHLKYVNNQVNIVLDIIRSGLNVRCIYEVPSNSEHREYVCKNYIDKFFEAGEQVRILDSLPAIMTVFDDDTVMFALDDPVSGLTDKPPAMYMGSQYVKNRVMANSFKMLFEMLWEKAEDYQEYKKRMKID